MTTYDEILNSMKAAFFESCGESVGDYSDTEARLEAAASELFSIACAQQYVLRQAFPQTAGGEYLDYHAALRGITRKGASRAQGELTFYVDEAAQQELVIPAGTICSKENEPFIQFETLEATAIQSGETQATAGARALRGSWEYNAPGQSVTVMVNAPAGVDGVFNASAFTGGACAESDTALRERILEAYSVPQTGYSLSAIRTALLENSDLTDCRVSYDSGEVTVEIRLKDGADFSEAENRIKSAIAVSELFGCTVNVVSAEEHSYSLGVEAKVGSTDSAETAERIKAALEEYISSVGIGEDIHLNRLVYCVTAVPEVSYCEVSSPQAVQGIILCPAGSYLSLNGIRVSCYE